MRLVFEKKASVFLWDLECETDVAGKQSKMNMIQYLLELNQFYR